MLRTDLIDLVNTGRAWALIGSGPSIDAGGPTWEKLVVDAAQYLDETGLKASSDSRYRRALAAQDLLVCFSRLVEIADRTTVEGFVRGATTTLAPGRLTRSIADWPFAGIITTNYDSCLEQSLRGGSEPWISVGNTAADIPSITGDVERVVWHVHGASDLVESKLVLTQEDYDELYNDASPVADAMFGLLQQKRIVAIGFGFNDPEVVRLIRRVGRRSSPERPVFAFIGGLDGAAHDAERDELLTRYNVDVVPYRVVERSHAELGRLVPTYGAFTVRRSLKLRQQPRHAPAWDTETTALLTYNELVLKHGATLDFDVLQVILRARIVARLHVEGSLTLEEVHDDLVERARLLVQAESAAMQNGRQAIEVAVAQLEADGLVSIEDERCVLSPTGRELVRTQAGQARLLRARFAASLLDRVTANGGEGAGAQRIADVLSLFFEDCMQRRGLGVAMAWEGATQDSRRFQTTALLQHLPDFLEQLHAVAEVEIAVHSVQDLLASPSTSERVYLGVRTQAQFSVSLLGYSPELIESRVQELKQTAFVLDSNIMIPLLARSAPGHGSSAELVNDLCEIGAYVGTIDFLVQEVRDHARWAKGLIDKAGTAQSPSILQASTGRAGFRENLFLAGLLAEAAEPAGSMDLDDYIDSVCGEPNAHRCHLDAFKRAIERRRVEVRSLEKWVGFESELYAERDAAQEEIEIARRERNTYRGPLQVKAEAEARLLVDQIRTGSLTVGDRTFSQSFFVSNSRVVDFVGGLEKRITMRPELVLQWLSTLRGASPSDLSCLVDGMLWELAQDDLKVVDRSVLNRVFAPLIDASAGFVADQRASSQRLASEEYGEDPDKAFHDSLYAPIMERAYLEQRVMAAENDRDLEKQAKVAAQNVAKMTEREKAELERLRNKRAVKQRKGVRKRRASQSKGKKKS